MKLAPPLPWRVRSGHVQASRAGEEPRIGAVAKRPCGLMDTALV